MNNSPFTLNSLPPRLTMDEYADFIETSIQAANPVLAARQKELEERIDTPFCLSPLADPLTATGQLRVGGPGELV